MERQVTRKPAVLRDLIEQADYIAQNNPEVALRFLQSADATFLFLAEAPELGTVCNFSNPELKDVRRWRVKGFDNHLIFYRAVEHGVDIIRVLHGARDIAAIFETASPESSR